MNSFHLTVANFHVAITLVSFEKETSKNSQVKKITNLNDYEDVTINNL
jgi:hypothetical protein